MHIIPLLLITLFAVAGCKDSTPQPPPTSFTIQGTITSAIGVSVDSDSNDPEAPTSDNSSPEAAQQLSNPALAGGYVTKSGDPVDWYRVTLARGQAVTLFISDQESGADLDLELYPSNGSLAGEEPAAKSDSPNSPTESVRIAQTGEYLVAIKAFDGESNYLLAIGQPARLPQMDPLPEDEFVPGEVIVRFRSSEDAAGGRISAASSAGLIEKRGSPGRAMLFTLEERGEVGAASDNTDLKRRTMAMVRTLRQRPDVEFAELNYIRRPLAIPDDESYHLQWNYPLLNLPQAWEVARKNRSQQQVIVAVVDTGVFLNHPDLKGNLLDSGYDFISNVAIAADGDGIDGNPDDPGDGASPAGSSYHGTHVAGIIGAVSDNGRGVAGVTWGTGTKIMPIRVLGRGGGTTYDIIQGVRYAAGLENDSGTIPPQPADVINLSLGGSNPSAAERALYDELYDKGIIVVSAAGNGGSSAPSYPAAYESVISVSAVTTNGELAGYSNHGATIDVAAPGGSTQGDINGDGYPDGILSTLVDGQRNPVYGFAQGTSMAAPHVAGVAALMKSLDPDLTAERFRTLLKTGMLTTDIGDEGRDDLFGHGLIDALKAVQNSGATLPPLLAIDRSGPLDFGLYLDELEFTTRNAGDGQFNITGVVDDADWLQVNPSSATGSEQTFTAAVDRTGLVDGIHSATITLLTDAQTSLEIPVTVQKGKRQDKGDTGRLYILLLDPATTRTLRMVAADNTDGRYRFSFSGVPEGEYLVVAGSDLDNDGNICDPGEACGGYPTIERLQPVAVHSDMDAIEFGASFRITISTLSTDGIVVAGEGFSRHP